MVVLAFLTDPDVVQKILTHLGLPTTAPALAATRTSQPEMGFTLAAQDAVASEEAESDDAPDSRTYTDRSPP